MKKIISLLLVLSMAFTALPLNIFAQGDYSGITESNIGITVTDEGGLSLDESADTFVPEDYEQIILTSPGIDFDNEIQISLSYTPQVLYASTGYLSKEEAALVVRENIKNRVSQFTLRIKTDIKPGNAMDLINYLFDTAAEHTGNPKEGDYIQWQYGGFNVSASYGVSGGYYYYSLPFNIPYYTTAQQEAELDAAIKSLLDSLDLYDSSDFEKVKGIYDYICQNVTYDHENLEDDSHKLKYTAYAALMNKTAVCQGYALLFYRLALELGIDNRLISGDSFEERHGWNIVKLDGKYYNLDTTWDHDYAVSGRDYKYFLRCKENFEDHTRDDKFETEEFHQKYPMSDSDYEEVVFVIQDGVLVGYNGKRQHHVVIPNGVTAIAPNVFDGCSFINSIVIPDSVTSIGEGAFKSCIYLNSINIPSGVTSIPDNAFLHCSSLQNITLHQGITSIGEGAFGYCTSLKSIDIPAGITEIKDNTFMYNTALESINLPEGLVSIGDSAFTGCELISEIDFPAGLKSIGEHAFHDCDSLVTLDFPEGLTEIKKYAFHYCDSLVSVTIPGSVSAIGDNAFGSCDSLESVSMGEGISVIGEGAFSYCRKLSEINIPEGVVEIKYMALAGTDSLKEIVLPLSLETVGQRALDGSFEKITFLNPETVLYDTSDTINKSAVIYGYMVSTARSYAKANGLEFVPLDPETEVPIIDSGTCGENLTWTINEDGVLKISGTGEMTSNPWCSEYEQNIKSVIIEEGVTSICNNAFESCRLTEATLPSTIVSIGDRAFWGSYLSKINLPEGLESIGFDAFSSTRLGEIAIPESITSIGTSAFSNISNLKTVDLPDSLKEIPKMMFNYCSGLETISLPEGLVSIGSYAFSSCERLTSIAIPDGVTTIGDSAFSNCLRLTSVSIPNSVTSIGGYAFNYCSKLTSITIPNGVKTIKWNAFSNCSSLTSITIPSSVTSVSSWAFYYCKNLTSITFESSTTEIYDSSYTISDTAAIYGYDDSTAQAYAEKYNRTFVSLGAAPVVEIASGTCGDNLTWSLTNYGTLTISGEGEMTNYGLYSAPWYSYGSSIKTAIIENGATSIGDYAFQNCSNLTDISIPDGVTSIGNGAFSDCISLANITIPNGVTTIGQSAFDSCTNLTNITIPDKVTSIGNSAFRDCTNLTSITIPESVTSISVGAFNGCSSLTSITFKSAITGIFDFATTISDTATIYGYDDSTAQTYAEKYDRTFVSLGAAPAVEIASGTCGDNVTWSLTDDGKLTISGEGEMYDYAYLDTNLGQIVRSPWNEYSALITSVCIENGVTTIGNDSFYNCTNLTDVSLPAGLTDIGNFAFDGCSSLQIIDIPNGVISIGDGAFNECDSLNNVVLPNSLKDICLGAFLDCDSLKSIEIPDSVSNIGLNAFYKCSSLTSIYFKSATVEIYDSIYTLPESAVIYGYEGSTAQAYAEKYGREFIDLATLYTVGDVDGNDVVDNNDAIYLLYHTIFGEEEYPLSQNCDYDGNGTVDNNDAIYLLYYTIFGEEEYPLHH